MFCKTFLFVKKSPSGWDNEGKINILLENSTTIKSDTSFSEIIYKPSIRKPLQRDVETVIAYEDQEFLSKLQLLLNKTATPTVKSVSFFPSFLKCFPELFSFVTVFFLLICYH